MDVKELERKFGILRLDNARLDLICADCGGRLGGHYGDECNPACLPLLAKNAKLIEENKKLRDAYPKLVDLLKKMLNEFEVDEIDGGTAYQAELCLEVSTVLEEAGEV